MAQPNSPPPPAAPAAGGKQECGVGSMQIRIRIPILNHPRTGRRRAAAGLRCRKQMKRCFATCCCCRRRLPPINILHGHHHRKRRRQACMDCRTRRCSRHCWCQCLTAWRGFSAAGSIATTLPGSPDCLSWLQPEAFYWRLLQQLLAVIGDPGYNVVAALQRLRCSLDEGTAPLTLAEAGVAHCRGVASTETASGDGTDDNSTDANGDANSGADGGSGGDAGVSAAGVTSLEPFVTSAAVELMAEVLARLAKRGHAATAADALLACTSGLGPAYETDEKHYGGRQW
ncbi:hypothetical protein Vretimale_19823 [Volvox reticuliferus]|uniref:Uncharacterized protein n=1 Tax=Volvox reticuliferus TaxID=1737510 RepID=A0A8J4M0Y0_9CHLO|nr:hypothetical protein Vretimale_19823 [Volvox reticuliferus]